MLYVSFFLNEHHTIGREPASCKILPDRYLECTLSDPQLCRVSQILQPFSIAGVWWYEKLILVFAVISCFYITRRPWSFTAQACLLSNYNVYSSCLLDFNNAPSGTIGSKVLLKYLFSLEITCMTPSSKWSRRAPIRCVFLRCCICVGWVSWAAWVSQSV